MRDPRRRRRERPTWRQLRPRYGSPRDGRPGRRRSRTRLRRSGRRWERRRGRSRRARRTASGRRRLIGVIRSSCWRSRRRPGCRSWCRSATGGCWCRRSRSSAARPTRWRPIWPARPGPGWRCSCAAMRICRTSVGSPRPIGGWCSASTTSMRRCRARSSGTSSAWWPASRSPAAIAASTPSSGNRST